MIINHNLAANNAIRNMNTNSTNASKSMQKLSSGLRINSAADDAAGLAISEKMRGQIRGLDQASSNAQDGISLTQTAEGGLSETTSILQRMRELATQSASDTNTSSDRSNIQKEVDQLSKEITRISNTTQFNTQNLLNGGMKAGAVGEDTFQIGANNGQSISISINAMDAKSLGVSRDAKTATLGTNNATVASAEADNGLDNKLAAGTYTVKVASVVAGAAVDAGTTGITGVTTTGTPTADFAATFTYHATANGSGTQGTATIADGTVTNGATAMGTITRTGTIATADGGNYQLLFTGATTYKLQKETATPGTYADVAGATGTVASADTNIAGTSFTVAAAAGGGAYASGDTMKFSITADTAANWTTSATSGATFSASYATNASNINANGTTIDLSGATGNADGEAITITGHSTAATTVQLFDSAGTTNIGNAMTVDKANGGTYNVGNTTTGELAVTFSAGQATAGSTTVTVADSASSAATFDNGQKQADASTTAGIDVSTQKAASIAITKIDAAIQSVSAERAKLGAFSNRLEHTIANLGTSSENLTSAESRIRDVDMAKEMSSFSKNNILSQAAQAMLAQANQQPQQVLQLLR